MQGVSFEVLSSIRKKAHNIFSLTPPKPRQRALAVFA